MKEDKLFNFLLEKFEGINRETLENDEENFSRTISHMNVYFELTLPFLSINPDNSSLFKFRYLELKKQLPLLHFTITSGLHYQSIRELRYILESFIQAYYLDKNHPKGNMDFKLEILKDNRLFGSRLIDNITDLKYKKELKTLYSGLSKHVHSSYEKLMPVLNYDELEHNIQFSFNERMLNESVEFMDKTFDAIFFLVFSYNKELISKDNENLLKTFETEGYELTSKFIKENNTKK